jgi:hypothetical protein
MEIPRLQTRLESWVYKREFVNKLTELNEVNNICNIYKCFLHITLGYERN